MKMRSASMPGPHASEGFAASSPGSSASGMRADRRVRDLRANGTPRVGGDVDEQHALAARVVDRRAMPRRS